MKFKVGDRVAVYWVETSRYATVGADGLAPDLKRGVTKISIIYQNGVVSLKTGAWEDIGDFGPDHVHISQCKRLVKKERRRVWIREKDIPLSQRSGLACIASTKLVGEEFIEFIEVKRKAKP